MDEWRVKYAGLEHRLDRLETTRVRGAALAAIVCLVGSLFFPLLQSSAASERRSEGVYLFTQPFLLLGQRPDSAGRMDGENTLLGIGVLGTLLCLMATVAFLVKAMGRRARTAWFTVGAVASALLTIGVLVLFLLMAPATATSSPRNEFGLGMGLLAVGILLSLWVVWGLRSLTTDV